MIATESLSLSELVVSEGLRAETQLRSRQGTQQLHLTHYSFCLPFSHSLCLDSFSFFAFNIVCSLLHNYDKYNAKNKATNYAKRIS